MYDYSYAIHDEFKLKWVDLGRNRINRRRAESIKQVQVSLLTRPALFEAESISEKSIGSFVVLENGHLPRRRSLSWAGDSEVRNPN